MCSDDVSLLGHIHRLFAALLVAGLCLALCGPGLGSPPVEERDVSWLLSAGDTEIPVARTHKPSLWVERAFEVELADLDPALFSMALIAVAPRPYTDHHESRSSRVARPHLARGPPASEA